MAYPMLWSWPGGGSASAERKVRTSQGTVPRAIWDGATRWKVPQKPNRLGFDRDKGEKVR